MSYTTPIDECDFGQSRCTRGCRGCRGLGRSLHGSRARLTGSGACGECARRNPFLKYPEDDPAPAPERVGYLSYQQEVLPLIGGPCRWRSRDYAYHTEITGVKVPVVTANQRQLRTGDEVMVGSRSGLFRVNLYVGSCNPFI